MTSELETLILVPAALYLGVSCSSASWRPPLKEGNDPTWSSKSRVEALRPLRWKCSVAWLCLEILSPNYLCQHVPNSHFTGIKWLIASGPTPHAPEAPPTGDSQGCGRIPVTSPQNTCGWANSHALSNILERIKGRSTTGRNHICLFSGKF